MLMLNENILECWNIILHFFIVAQINLKKKEKTGTFWIDFFKSETYAT